jgi:hypothetical protein
MTTRLDLVAFTWDDLSLIDVQFQLEAVAIFASS